MEEIKTPAIQKRGDIKSGGRGVNKKGLFVLLKSRA